MSDEQRKTIEILETQNSADEQLVEIKPDGTLVPYDPQTKPGRDIVLRDPRGEYAVSCTSSRKTHGWQR
jgi:hypothetical protein